MGIGGLGLARHLDLALPNALALLNVLALLDSGPAPAFERAERDFRSEPGVISVCAARSYSHSRSCWYALVPLTG
jgi:hypothetical protein